MSNPSSDSYRNPLRHTGQDYSFAPRYLRPRDPLAPTGASRDIKPKENQGYYPLGSIWNNSSNGNIWILSSITNNLANWVLLSSGGGGDPINEIDTQLGNATPILSIIIMNGINSGENNDNGIITKGGVVGTGVQNEVDVVITNRLTGTLITANATLTTIITLPLIAPAGSFYVYGNVQAYSVTSVASATFSYSGGFRTTGAAATELGIEIHDEFKEPALATADILLSASGNNAILEVQGVVGNNIKWTALMEYRRTI